MNKVQFYQIYCILFFFKNIKCFKKLYIYIYIYVFEFLLLIYFLIFLIYISIDKLLKTNELIFKILTK